jgi:PAS domain S-box-containing protein
MRAFPEGVDATTPFPGRDAGTALRPQATPTPLSARAGTADEAPLWAAVAASMHEQIAVLDADGTIVAVNEAWRLMARDGGLPDDLVGASYLAACDAAGDDSYARQAAWSVRSVLAGTLPAARLVYPLGDRWYMMRVAPVLGADEGRAVVVHADVTDEAALEREAEDRARLLDEVDVAVTAVDAAGRVTAWNSAAERMFGRPREEAVGLPVAEVLVVDQAAGRWGADGTHADEEQVVMRRADGSRFHARHRAVGRPGSDGGYVCVTLDSTAEARALQDIVETSAFLEAVTDSMGEGLVVLDVAGRPVLMNEAAERLLGWRIDEVRDRVMHDVCHSRRPDGSPYPLDDCPLVASWRDHVSVRVTDDAFVTRDGRHLPVSYTAAPLAGGAGCVVVFGDATKLRAEERRLRQELHDLTAVVRIRDVLASGRLALHAQPIVLLETGEVVQHELLLRVPGPDGTLGGPVDFLADAERLGLSGDVDRWVVRRSLELAATGRAIELNLSAASLNDHRLLADIATWIDELGVDPATVCFEITETALIADEEAGRLFVSRLRDLGCQIALDDFGTGYGGFTYLKKLAVDFLKIDIEFVRDLTVNAASRHVVQAVVHLARSFGLQTVAEGVEDAESLTLLRELGVDFAQGYHLGRPAPLDERDPA